MTKFKWFTLKRLGLFVLVFAVAMTLLGILTALPAASQGNTISLADWSSKSCQACHPREWTEWSRSGHAMTLSAQLTNPAHNSGELLDQTCVKCHSPELGTVKISDIVQPMDTKGPWKLVGTYAANSSEPSIPCLACHQPHTPQQPGLLPGMDFADESTFYRNVAPPQISNLYIYDAFAQKYVDPQLIAAVFNNGQPVPIAQTRANQLCYTCHATALAESNLFAPQTPPSGDNSVSSSDDRTLTGAHQGIECVTCHMPGGSHTFNPMNSCGQCHGNGGATAPLAYVTTVQTSYNDPSLSMLSGNQSPLNIHWLDKTQLWPPVAVAMTATDTGDTVTYNITLTNYASWDVTDVTLRASIPKGAGYLDSQILSANAPGKFDGSDAVFTLGVVPSGQSFGPITYRVAKGTATDFTAHAWASWAGAIPGTSNSAEVTITK